MLEGVVGMENRSFRAVLRTEWRQRRFLLLGSTIAAIGGVEAAVHVASPKQATCAVLGLVTALSALLGAWPSVGGARAAREWLCAGGRRERLRWTLSRLLLGLVAVYVITGAAYGLALPALVESRISVGGHDYRPPDFRAALFIVAGVVFVGGVAWATSLRGSRWSPVAAVLSAGAFWFVLWELLPVLREDILGWWTGPAALAFCGAALLLWLGRVLVFALVRPADRVRFGGAFSPVLLLAAAAVVGFGLQAALAYRYVFTNGAWLDTMRPLPSHDGRLVALRESTWAGQRWILIDAETGTRRRIPGFASILPRSAWSPDDRRFLYGFTATPREMFFHFLLPRHSQHPLLKGRVPYYCYDLEAQAARVMLEGMGLRDVGGWLSADRLRFVRIRRQPQVLEIRVDEMNADGGDRVSREVTLKGAGNWWDLDSSLTHLAAVNMDYQSPGGLRAHQAYLVDLATGSFLERPCPSEGQSVRPTLIQPPLVHLLFEGASESATQPAAPGRSVLLDMETGEETDLRAPGQEEGIWVPVSQMVGPMRFVPVVLSRTGSAREGAHYGMLDPERKSVIPLPTAPVPLRKAYFHPSPGGERWLIDGETQEGGRQVLWTFEADDFANVSFVEHYLLSPPDQRLLRLGPSGIVWLNEREVAFISHAFWRVGSSGKMTRVGAHLVVYDVVEGKRTRVVSLGEQ